jgi:hypothetical protein
MKIANTFNPCGMDMFKPSFILKKTKLSYLYFKKFGFKAKARFKSGFKRSIEWFRGARSRKTKIDE